MRQVNRHLRQGSDVTEAQMGVTFRIEDLAPKHLAFNYLAPKRLALKELGLKECEP